MVPIFPLPETVFFPSVTLALHVFEPRYRQMTEDVMGGDGRLVVVLLRHGWENDYDGTPPVHEIATLGKIEDHERLSDGRFNIVIRGVERVRLVEAEFELAPGKLYRVRHAESAPESTTRMSEATVAASDRLRSLWRELLEKSGKRAESAPSRGLEELSFEALVNAIATFADIPPTAKQELLEEDDVLLRATRLEGHIARSLRFWATLARFRASGLYDPSVN